MRRSLAAGLVVGLVVAACGVGSEPLVTTTSTRPVDPVTNAGIVVPGQLADLGVVMTSLGDSDLVLAVADEPLERTAGLMFITDLDDLDGMVFAYRTDTTTTFHMENTLIPLDIAFFASDGSFVSKTTMTPCLSDECPSYGAEGRYRYAIEVPAGAFDGVDASTMLDVTPLAD